MTSLLFCVEPGILFSQAVLLAESVAKYTDNYFNGVFAFSPRQAHQLSDSESHILENLGVTIIKEPLNTQYLDYPIANKILACLWAEKNLSDDLLLMVDSDTIFLQPPKEINHPDFDVFMRPVDRPGQASQGPDSEHESYWVKAYELCHKDIPKDMIPTGVNCVPIRPYFNAGFVAYKRQLNLATTWKLHLDTLRNHSHHPNNPRCLDQVSLAITTSDSLINVLPNTYNYPIPLRSRMTDSETKNLQLDELVHVHYHRWFQKHGFFELLNPNIKSHEKLDWLLERLPLKPEICDIFPH